MYGQYVVPEPEDFVKFGVGQPAKQMLPLELIQKYGLSYLQSLTDPSVLQYGSIQGYDKFLDLLANYLNNKYNEKCNISKKNLFITNGVSNALFTICSMFAHKKPIFIVEDPTYFLAKDIFVKDFKFDVKAVDIENDGINIEQLEKQLEELKDEEMVILYTIPTFHNPTSYTMSHEKREKLADFATKYENLYIIADEVYQLLYFDNNIPPSPLCYYCPKKTISLGSFSKILAPSLRLGWMQIMDNNIMKIFVDSGLMDSSGGNSPFIQALVHGIIQNNKLDENINSCRNFLKTNCNALSNLVRQYLNKYVDFIEPSGGYFLWLKLKNPLTAEKLLIKANDYKIHFHSGARFSIRGCGDYIRLSFSYYDANGFEIGIKRLALLCEDTLKSINIIGVLGNNGRLGSKIIGELENSMGLGRNYNIDTIKLCSCIIDVSSPSGTHELLLSLINNDMKIPLVIGTTGIDTNGKTYRLITEYSKFAPVALISNFSDGIPQVLKLIDNIDKNKWNIEMKETHHIHKKDAPSGTAITLANHIKNKVGSNVDIESIREGEVYGEHQITMQTNDEEIIVKHSAKNRNLFAHGAIKYALWIQKQKNGLYKSMANNIKFSKYEACGNNFIIINGNDINGDIDVVKMCDSNKGIGADGLIVVLKDDYIRWTYYNKDGSTVEMCGNGARCVVKYCIDTNMIDNYDIKLQNNYNIIQSITIKDNLIYVSMPKPVKTAIEPNKLSQLIKLKDLMCIGYATVGVPHIVFNVITGNIYELNISELSRHIISIMGKDMNVNFMQEISGKIHIRTYERGINEETQACGSGCCASAYLYKINGNVNGYIEFITKSRDCIVVYIGDDVYLSGPANKIYDGIYG